MRKPVVWQDPARWDPSLGSVRGATITNGGLNTTPQPYNPLTGLAAPQVTHGNRSVPPAPAQSPPESGGVTSVTFPPNPSLYRAGPHTDVFVRFDVPRSAIGAGDGKIAKIYGPSSLIGRARGVTEMPIVSNIVVGEP